MSNGTRSTQRDEGITYYDHMLPAEALNKIRSVTVHSTYGHIRGFSFFDKDGALLWWIGDTIECFEETVEIAENEFIVGVVTKMLTINKSIYTDFQFQIALE